MLKKSIPVKTLNMLIFRHASLNDLEIWYQLSDWFQSEKYIFIFFYSGKVTGNALVALPVVVANSKLTQFCPGLEIKVENICVKIEICHLLDNNDHWV